MRRVGGGFTFAWTVSSARSLLTSAAVCHPVTTPRRPAGHPAAAGPCPPRDATRRDAATQRFAALGPAHRRQGATEARPRVRTRRLVAQAARSLRPAGWTACCTANPRPQRRQRRGWGRIARASGSAARREGSSATGLIHPAKG
eukprot:148374-Chlamydomonas_euryale.AAC.3